MLQGYAKIQKSPNVLQFLFAVFSLMLQGYVQLQNFFFPLLFRMLRYRSHQMSCSFYLLYYRPIFGKINIVMQNLYLNLHVGNLFGEPKRLNKDTRIFSFFLQDIFLQSNNLKRVPTISSLAPQVHMSLQYAFSLLILQPDTPNVQTNRYKLASMICFKCR